MTYSEFLLVLLARFRCGAVREDDVIETGRVVGVVRVVTSLSSFAKLIVDVRRRDAMQTLLREEKLVSRTSQLRERVARFWTSYSKQSLLSFVQLLLSLFLLFQLLRDHFLQMT